MRSEAPEIMINSSDEHPEELVNILYNKLIKFDYTIFIDYKYIQIATSVKIKIAMLD